MCAAVTTVIDCAPVAAAKAVNAAKVHFMGGPFLLMADDWTGNCGCATTKP
jgi:hypothetical protein